MKYTLKIQPAPLVKQQLALECALIAMGHIILNVISLTNDGNCEIVYRTPSIVDVSMEKENYEI